MRLLFEPLHEGAEVDTQGDAFFVAFRGRTSWTELERDRPIERIAASIGYLTYGFVVKMNLRPTHRSATTLNVSRLPTTLYR